MNIELTKVIYEISTQTEPYNIEKVFNDDWDIEAYDIPRDCLSYWKYTQLNTKHPNLHYHGIYFLVSEDNKQVYVGKGTDVLERVKNHVGSRGEAEPYYNNWNRVIIFISKYRVGEHYLSWDDNMISALESFMMQEVKNKFNQVIPSNGGNNRQAFEELIEQIKIILKALRIDTNIFNHNLKYTDSITPMTETEYNKYNKFEYIGNNQSSVPQIVTPKRVVKAMVDMLPDEVWNDKTVFIDPACKGGEYLREIFDRLMAHQTLKDKYPNVTIRVLHILSKQLYGIALDEKSRQRTIDTLSQGAFDNNIKIIPDYIKKLKDGRAKEIIKGAFGENMTFDVVISNPPYQNNTTSIYPKFIDLALAISDRVCMITRNNWLTSDKIETTRKKMVEAGIQEIINYPKIGEVFRGLNVSVSIFNIDRNKSNNNTTYKEICNGEIKNEYTLTSNPAVIFTNTYENSIYAKIKSALGSDTFSKFVLPVEPFKLTSGGIVGRGDNAYELDMRSEKDSEYDVDVWRMERNGVPFGNYCKFADVPARSELIDTYKIICGKVLKNSGTVISNLRAIEKHSICDSSWAVLYYSENGEEVLNVQKYISTKFFRFLVSVLVEDGVIGVSPYRFSLIPLQNFISKSDNSDIDWSKPISDINKQLYKKYNLTQDEIDYIENTILPID